MAVAHSFTSVYRALQEGQIAPVYYLTGDEDVLKDELVALLIDQTLEPTSRDFNLDVRSAADLNAESLHALVETPPMLAERRVVVVKNLEHWRKSAKIWQVLDRYLERPSPTTVLVLTQGPGQEPRSTVMRATEHVGLDPLNPDRLVRWIVKRAERSGFAIAADAAQHLVGAVGSNLSVLTMEIDKLAAAAPDGEVGIDLVSALVGIRRGETPLDWVDAVLHRDLHRATSMLGTVLAISGVTGVKLLASLGTGLLGVRLARAHLDAGRNARQAQDAVYNALRTCRPKGVRSWKDESRRWTRAAAQWTAADLADALRAAYDTDRALKSTTVSDERGTLMYMMLRVGRIEAAA
jgi:DNA polymerase-3 subunit delta